MPIADTWNITRPGQVGATGAINALHLEEYTGQLTGTIARKSVLDPWVKRKTVKGTSVISNKAIGESSLQVVTPGSAIDGTKNKVGKVTLTIDTLIAARSVFPLLETWQADYDARSETAIEHGKKFAKFTDQAFFIQAMKAGLRTTTAYSGVDAASGHFGGTQKTLAGANDHLDPAKLYAALADLFAGMEAKDVDPRTDDIIVAVKPAEYYTLLQNEQLVNINYVTAKGTSIETMALKSYGVPIVSSNNFLGGTNVTTHELGSNYLGDFTKVVAAAFNAESLLAGETIPLTPQMYWNDDYLQWVVGSYTSFGVTVDKAHYAGVILKP